MCSVHSLFVTLVYYVSFTIAQPTRNFDCTTPTNKTGICIDLRNCDDLFRMLIQRPLPPTDRMHLRKSQCGYLHRSPLVCCPPHRQAKLVKHQRFGVEHLPKPGVCGSSLPTGGSAVPKPGEFPWMAQILYWKCNSRIRSYCGGSLINENYVITASHCVSGHKLVAQNAKILAVRLGHGAVDIPIVEIIPHRDYDRTSFQHENDIALLRLMRPVQFTDSIRPICLPIFDRQIPLNYDLLRYTVASWRSGAVSRALATRLKLKISMPGVPLDRCNSIYNIFSVSIGAKQLCAGGIERRDSCHGDSGNPLMFLDNSVDSNSYWYLGGIVSFGPAICGTKGWPGAYTRVSSYIGWILENIRP